MTQRSCYHHMLTNKFSCTVLEFERNADMDDLQVALGNVVQLGVRVGINADMPVELDKEGYLWPVALVHVLVLRRPGKYVRSQLSCQDHYGRFVLETFL